MDRCYDLLELKAKEITVLDDKDEQIHLKGLARVLVNLMSEFSEAFSCAIQWRKVAHTGINNVSSRSHGVLVNTVNTPGLGSLIGMTTLVISLTRYISCFNIKCSSYYFFDSVVSSSIVYLE